MRWVMCKKKVWSWFRLSTKRFWQNPSKNKRYNAPHLNSMRYIHHQVHSHTTTQDMSAVRPSFCFLKLSDFFVRIVRKHFQYVRRGYNSHYITKLKRFYETNNTHKRALHHVQGYTPCMAKKNPPARVSKLSVISLLGTFPSWFWPGSGERIDCDCACLQSLATRQSE